MPFFASTPPEYFQRPEMTLEISRAEKAPVTGSNMPMVLESCGTMIIWPFGASTPPRYFSIDVNVITKAENTAVPTAYVATGVRRLVA